MSEGLNNHGQKMTDCSVTEFTTTFNEAKVLHCPTLSKGETEKLRHRRKQRWTKYEEWYTTMNHTMAKLAQQVEDRVEKKLQDNNLSIHQKVDAAVDTLLADSKREAHISDLLFLSVREENRKDNPTQKRMKVVSWNCRGLSNTDTPAIPYLVWLVRKFSVNILFLMETHLNGGHVQRLCRVLGYDFCDYVFVSPSSGGLTVFWSSSIDMHVSHKCPNFFHCIISDYDVCSLHAYNLLLVSGSPYISEGSHVWNQLSDILSSSNQPFVIQGDFIQIESLSHKWGGSSTTLGSGVFNNWLTTWNLIDIPYHRIPFTWCNNREGDDCVYERLDRVYVTQEWLHFYPKSINVNFPISLSDHSPILFDSQPMVGKRKSPIKMESWCLGFNEVQHMIQDH
ncbi:putative RNA-directed DNA polymerase from transposon X-element [Bienertia sinuspersici]